MGSTGSTGRRSAGSEPPGETESPPGTLLVLWRRLLNWLMTHWPGRTVMRTARSFTRTELFDRSMTVAAQLFTCVMATSMVACVPPLNCRTKSLFPDSSNCTILCTFSQSR